MKKKFLVWLIAGFILGLDYIADAQQSTKIPQIGFISSAGSPTVPSPQFEAFRLGFRELGYIEGKDIVFLHLYAEGKLDQMPRLVNDLLQQKVDVLVAPNNVAIRAAQQATQTVPIVMLSSVDPVEAGYVKSFARPGGNITGLAALRRDLSAKRVELLKDMFPKVARIGILWDPEGPGPAVAFKEYEAAIRAFKLEFRSFEARSPKPDFGSIFQSMKGARAEVLIVVSNPLMTQYAKEIFNLATKYRIPSMTEESRYVNAGGLISYGASSADLNRRAAGYVVDILKGAKPGDLPIKLPEKFEIFINLKTAQQIGVVIPQRVLIQADKVIK